MGDGTDHGVGRRGVLSGAVAAIGATLGLASPAAAKRDGLRRAGPFADAVTHRRYGDVATFETVFAEHEDALAELASRGFLQSASAADLDLQPGVASRDGALDRVTVAETTDGGPTPELKVSRTLADGMTATMAVRPETGERYAVVGGEEPTPLQTVTAIGCCQCCMGEYYCCGWDDGFCVEFCTRCDCSDPGCECPPV